MWSQTVFDDTERIRTVLTQQKLDAEQAFANSGHSYALARAMSYTDDKKRLGQHFGGVDYYRFVCDLLKDWAGVSRGLPAKLTDVCKRTFKRGNDYHSFTGPKCDLAAYWDKAGTFGLEEAKARQRASSFPLLRSSTKHSLSPLTCVSSPRPFAVLFLATRSPAYGTWHKKPSTMSISGTRFA